MDRLIPMATDKLFAKKISFKRGRPGDRGTLYKIAIQRGISKTVIERICLVRIPMINART